MRPLLSVVLMFSLVWSGLAQVVAPREGIPPQTGVEIELLESISSETLQVGQTIPFKLVRDLESDGSVLLPAGTPFSGTVTSANAAKHWGKAGAFDLKFNPLKLQDGTLVRLDFHHPAKLNARGEKTGENIVGGLAMAYYFPLIPAALIMASRKGKPFNIRAGERYLVYVTGTEAAAAGLSQP